MNAALNVMLFNFIKQNLKECNTFKSTKSAKCLKQKAAPPQLFVSGILHKTAVVLIHDTDQAK